MKNLLVILVILSAILICGCENKTQIEVLKMIAEQDERINQDEIVSFRKVASHTYYEYIVRYRDGSVWIYYVYSTNRVVDRVKIFKETNILNWSEK